jgi:hypothetical protein
LAHLCPKPERSDKRPASSHAAAATSPTHLDDFTPLCRVDSRIALPFAAGPSFSPRLAAWTDTHLLVVAGISSESNEGKAMEATHSLRLYNVTLLRPRAPPVWMASVSLARHALDTDAQAALENDPGPASSPGHGAFAARAEVLLYAAPGGRLLAATEGGELRVFTAAPAFAKVIVVVFTLITKSNI